MDPSRRQQLHDLLKTFVPNVYFQPPTNTQLVYPCIIYSRNYGRTQHADNLPYRHTRRYTVQVIDRDPDSEILEKVEGLPLCTEDRFYTDGDLNHSTYNLFF